MFLAQTMSIFIILLSLFVSLCAAMSIPKAQSPLNTDELINNLFVLYDVLIHSSVFAKLTLHSGDSYTSVWFNPSGSQPRPSNPIGNPKFPGTNSLPSRLISAFLILLTYRPHRRQCRRRQKLDRLSDGRLQRFPNTDLRFRIQLRHRIL